MSRAISKSKDSCTRSYESTYHPIIPLQIGTYDPGPLFCVPGAGATVASFIDFVSASSRSRPIYGFQPRGLDSLLLPHSTVPAAAQAYVQALQNLQTKGPIHLLGHSFGGWVAFEMAKQLAEAGREVRSLTLVDTQAPDDDYDTEREYTPKDIILAWIEVFEDFLERPLDVNKSELDALGETAQRKLLHTCMVKEGIMPRHSRPDELRGPLRTFAAALRTQFIPDAEYQGAVCLALVKNRKIDGSFSSKQYQDLLDAWRRWAPNLVVVQAPATHMTILKAPNVNVLTELSQSHILQP
jgi:thioesterase domain-containing protein